MMKKILLLLLPTIFYWTTAIAQSTPTSPQQELTSLLSQFNAMSAQFTQIVYDAKKRPLQTSSGTMALQRPGKFRWEVTQPNPQLLIANGKFLWIYDKDLAQATRQKFDASNSNSAAMLLSGSVADVQTRFNITYPKKNPGPGQWFLLTPQHNKDMFQWVQLHFVNGVLASMRLADNLDTLTDFQFRKVVINPSLNAKLFTFKAPKGVAVINN